MLNKMFESAKTAKGELVDKAKGAKDKLTAKAKGVKDDLVGRATSKKDELVARAKDKIVEKVSEAIAEQAERAYERSPFYYKENVLEGLEGEMQATVKKLTGHSHREIQEAYEEINRRGWIVSVSSPEEADIKLMKLSRKNFLSYPRQVVHISLMENTKWNPARFEEAVHIGPEKIFGLQMGGWLKLDYATLSEYPKKLKAKLDQKEMELAKGKLFGVGVTAAQIENIENGLLRAQKLRRDFDEFCDDYRLREFVNELHGRRVDRQDGDEKIRNDFRQEMLTYGRDKLKPLYSELKDIEKLTGVPGLSKGERRRIEEFLEYCGRALAPSSDKEKGQDKAA